MKDDPEREYVEFSLRCQSRKCRTYILFVDNTIWEKVKDSSVRVYAPLFSRPLFHTISSQSKGVQTKTAEKYMHLLKNTLFLEMRSKNTRLCFGKLDIDQVVESLFKEEISVGWFLEDSQQGRILAAVEDLRDCILFIKINRHKDATTLPQMKTIPSKGGV